MGFVAVDFKPVPIQEAESELPLAQAGITYSRSPFIRRST